MLQIAIVVFREIFEIALFLSILITATKNIPNRSKWIASGMGIGSLLAILIALSINFISGSFGGLGQEFFNGSILIATSVMISITTIWMYSHAKSISSEIKKLGSEVLQGKKPLYMLAIVTMLTVLREGSETVLFTYSYYLAGSSINSIITGLLLGLAFGVTAGFGIYFGMLKVFGKYFFIVTTWILVFLASGVLASGVGFWINAGIIPPLADPLFDISEFLNQNSMLGKILHILFGYLDRPTGSQALAYVINILALTFCITLVKKTTLLKKHTK